MAPNLVARPRILVFGANIDFRKARFPKRPQSISDQRLACQVPHILAGQALAARARGMVQIILLRKSVIG